MNLELLNQRLTYLQLPFTRDNYAAFAQEAAAKHWDHIQFLDSLVQGESDQRRQRVIQRRIKEARFPVLKTLEQFRWDWPKKINRLAVQNLFRLEFLTQKANVVLLGNVGLGKTHLATALGYAACSNGSSNAIWARNCCSWMSSGICRSTSTVPICSSRSSASATNGVPSS